MTDQSPSGTSRVDRLEQQVAQLQERQTTTRAAEKRDSGAPRLAWRSCEAHQRFGLSKSTWHSLRARGIGPPAIETASGHVTLYLDSTLTDYANRSQEAGRLLTTKEYLDAVKMDREAEDAAQRRKLKLGGAA
jgi:hypothetical protein